MGAFQFKLRREGTLCFLAVLCCGENITFNQVAKFTVPLQNDIRAGCTGAGSMGRRPSGTIHHSNKGSQYVSLAYMQRLKEAGLLVSTGSPGDSYDNAMEESINGLYKTEVIHRKSWKKPDRSETGHTNVGGLV